MTDGSHATLLTDELRRASIGADRSFGGRSVKAQMKAADRSGASLAVIVGPDELAAGVCTVRDLLDGTQEQIPRVGLAGAIARKLETRTENGTT